MPRIEADESLRLALAVSLGSGMLKRSDAQRIRSAWTRAANGSHRAQKLDFREVAALHGIGIIEEGPSA